MALVSEQIWKQKQLHSCITVQCHKTERPQHFFMCMDDRNRTVAQSDLTGKQPLLFRFKTSSDSRSWLVSSSLLISYFSPCTTWLRFLIRQHGGSTRYNEHDDNDVIKARVPRICSFDFVSFDFISFDFISFDFIRFHLISYPFISFSLSSSPSSISLLHQWPPQWPSSHPTLQKKKCEWKTQGDKGMTEGDGLQRRQHRN